MPSLNRYPLSSLKMLGVTVLILTAASVLAERTAAQPADGLSMAMTAYVEQRGEQYAGDCAGTQSPDDLGEWCSKIVSQTGDEAKVMFGPTFSEFVVTVTFQQWSDEWEAVGEVPLSLVPGAEPYFVQPGDTLSAIAQRFGVSVEAIVRLNGITDPAVVRAGVTILIPKGQQTPGMGPEEPACLQGDDFAGGGQIADLAADESDAARILGFQFAAHAGCDRFEIELGTEDGSSAQALGPVTSDYLRELGIIRIHLSDQFALEDFAETPADITMDTLLLRSAYVVWSMEGRPYIDVHLRQPVLARLQVIESPARIILDVRPDAAEQQPAPAQRSNVVVVEPRPGSSLDYPITVKGYARTFESNVIARISVDGELREEAFTTATTWIDIWGEFEITLNDGPGGDTGGLPDLA